MPDKFKKNKDDDMNSKEFDDLDLEETLSDSLEEINDINSDDNTSLEQALDSIDSKEDLSGLDDLSDLTDIPDNPDDFSIDQSEAETGFSDISGSDLSMTGDVDLNLDSSDDLDIDLPLENDLEQASEMAPADDDALSAGLSSEEIPEVSDDIDLAKDLELGDEAMSAELDDSIKIDENGEVDLSQDLGDFELSGSGSEDTGLSAQGPELEDSDIDEELNLDDDFDINKEIELTESADPDSELDLDSISSSDLSLDSENIPGDELKAVAEEINIPELDDSLNDLESSELDDLDLKSDLGLEDSLKLSEGEDFEHSGEKADFDLVDDEGKPIGKSEEEYGVDLKSGPETIETYLFGRPENSDNEEIIEEDELDKRLEEDQEVEKIKVRKKKPLVIDDEQSDFLSKDISGMDELDISAELGDEEHEDEELLDEIKLDEDASLDETQELSLESLEDEAFSGNEPGSEEDKISLDEDLSEELGAFETIDDLDDINKDDAEIPSLREEMDDELTIGEEHFGPVSELPAETPEENSEDLDVDLLEDEIGGTEIDAEGISQEIPDASSDEPINLKGASKSKKDIDMSKIDKTPSELDTEITDDGGLEERPLQEDEAISIEDSELSDIEDKLFPDDGSMPPLDEDVANLELSSGTDEELENSVSPLSDAESVFSDDLSAEMKDDDEIKIDDIDLEHIPHPSLDNETEEEETIALSDDELDNIITGTQIIETDLEAPGEEEEVLSLEDELSKPEAFDEEESETIDMDSFDADLEEIKSDDLELSQSVEDEEAYADLRKEMKEKEEPVTGTPDVKSLKTNVKAVLSYLDRLLDALPEDKIREFAESDEFDVYKKLFEDLNIKY